MIKLKNIEVSSYVDNAADTTVQVMKHKQIIRHSTRNSTFQKFTNNDESAEFIASINRSLFEQLHKELYGDIVENMELLKEVIKRNSSPNSKEGEAEVMNAYENVMQLCRPTTKRG